MSVSTFLKGQGFGSATLAPLSRVVWSIVDLCEQNRPDPLFCEKATKVKARRSMEDAVKRGHLAALATAWLDIHRSKEGDERDKLSQAARRMSGPYFGDLNANVLLSALSYQRQNKHHDLLYKGFEQMTAALAEGSDSAGGGDRGLRAAFSAQLDALNAKAELRRA